MVTVSGGGKRVVELLLLCRVQGSAHLVLLRRGHERIVLLVRRVEELVVRRPQARPLLVRFVVFHRRLLESLHGRKFFQWYLYVLLVQDLLKGLAFEV